ncbi:Uncharacterised protein [uncultured archaeon]|nr:Uncharacterised protein [uncultured archaeon]
MHANDMPEFPGSRQIRLSDKPVFDELFERLQPKISEFTFAGLFIWSAAKNYRLCSYKGHLVIFHEENGVTFFLAPIGDSPAEIIMELIGKKSNSVFTAVPENIALALDGSGLLVKESPGTFDYVYRRQDLAELRGRKYAPKRSFIKRAIGKYSPEITSGEGITAEDCMGLLERWFSERKDGNSKSLAEEKSAITTLIGNKDSLGLSCVAVKIGRRLVAFAVGEPLNKSTYLVHFEKAERDYVGLYQLINKEFAEKVPVQFGFINREEDLGIPGLVKAKQSYYPAFMVKKFNVSAVPMPA